MPLGNSAMRTLSHQTPLSLAHCAPTLQPYHPFFGSFKFHSLFSLLHAVLSTQNVLPLVLHVNSHCPPEHPMLSTPLLLALSLPLVFCLSTLFIPCMTFIKTCNAGYLPNRHPCFFLANWTWFCSDIHDTAKCFRKGCPWPQPGVNLDPSKQITIFPHSCQWRVSLKACVPQFWSVGVC